jgi:hypothetical protein
MAMSIALLAQRPGHLGNCDFGGAEGMYALRG